MKFEHKGVKIMLKIEYESSSDSSDVTCHAQMLGPSIIEFSG